ncbi:hypothetical protein M9H77_27315 [Catharanthus roseus]|uniref:Uncharacterized protein n=1 Tax=Catharanthus roseus TaxID=4058 RepID=A0ACC0ADL4_CATRO|nr:hypothetical protein M9H77_27315 [Catharanthus roseus]
MWTLSLEPYCCITYSFEFGYRSCARNPHIEEEPSELKSDAEIIPEPEGVAPVDVQLVGSVGAGGPPMAASPTPAPPMESVSLFLVLSSLLRGGVKEYDIEASMATRRNEQVLVTGAEEALERFLKFRPPGFYGEVEQEIKAELFLEQLNDIYDTLKWDSRPQLKLPHGQRWLIKMLYRERHPLVKGRLHINVLDKDHGNLEIPRDPVASKGLEMIALYTASPLNEGLFRWHRHLTLRKVYPFEEGHRRGGRSPIGLRGHQNMFYVGVRLPRVRLIGNLALVYCLAGTDYEIPKLGSDDLVRGCGLCPWSPAVALHVLLNLGIEAMLMCLDLLRLPNCAENPHIA